MNTLYLITVAGTHALNETAFMDTLKRFGEVYQEGGAWYLSTSLPIQDVQRAALGLVGNTSLVIAPVDAAAIGRLPFYSEGLKNYLTRQSRAA